MIDLPRHDDIVFDVLTMEQLEIIRKERNQMLETLRTSFLLTKKMQEDFFNNTINNRNSNSRFFAIKTKKDIWPYNFRGYCGIENIEWENRRGEISLLILQEYRGKGLGKKVVEKILDKAFFEMNLDQVWGECYTTNLRAWEFWYDLTSKYEDSTFKTFFYNTKYFDGKYFDSLLFSFNKDLDINYNRRDMDEKERYG